MNSRDCRRRPDLFRSNLRTPSRTVIRYRRLLFGACGVVVFGCGGGVSDGTGPIAPVDSTKPPVGTVERGTITVRVETDPADAAIASAVGMNVAGLTVRLTRQLSSDAPVSGHTGPDGSVQFSNLLEGVYNASIDRPLTTSEQARLPVTDRDVSVFAGAATIVFTPPLREATVPLVASRRGSLMISEVFVYTNPPGGPAYGFGTYLEVYNAADTTIYLDGMLIGSTWGGMHRGDLARGPCETFNIASRLDSTSLWLGLVQAFPGAGRDFPIAPGQAKVIAMDAMNHSAASPTTNQVDLSNAAFEQHGDDADIDNPFVPNMITVRGGIGIFGRGYLVTPSNSYALLLPGAASRLVPGEIAALGGGSFAAYRVTPAFILDVLSVLGTPEETKSTSWYQGGGRICTPFLSPVFERDVAQIGDSNLRTAIRRKSLGFTSSGIELLQRTHTSSRDLEYAAPLRRSLDK